MPERIPVVDLGNGKGLVPVYSNVARVVDVSKGPVYVYETNGVEVFPAVPGAYVVVHGRQVLHGEEYLTEAAIVAIQGWGEK